MASQMTAPDEIQAPVDNQREADLARMRHSAAHVLAEAVLEIFPDAQLAIGPPSNPASTTTSTCRARSRPTTWRTIEERMRKHIAAAEPFERREVSRRRGRRGLRGPALQAGADPRPARRARCLSTYQQRPVPRSLPRAAR